jgi:hypothetical protein
MNEKFWRYIESDVYVTMQDVVSQGENGEKIEVPRVVVYVNDGFKDEYDGSSDEKPGMGRLASELQDEDVPLIQGNKIHAEETAKAMGENPDDQERILGGQGGKVRNDFSTNQICRRCEAPRRSFRGEDGVGPKEKMNGEIGGVVIDKAWQDENKDELGKGRAINKVVKALQDGILDLGPEGEDGGGEFEQEVE